MAPPWTCVKSGSRKGHSASELFGVVPLPAATWSTSLPTLLSVGRSYVTAAMATGELSSLPPCTSRPPLGTSGGAGAPAPTGAPTEVAVHHPVRLGASA